ncbi:nucleoside/nucleotide kinase family protein [Marinilactibacillus sp. Marseille-P9653]|uniref:nucleoside/nucleotide kinase family protein n=1 Tax=Marinilactibacillus sp. Marseille-P9653 TaxID=2866583 RepID=UPI001CE426A1|nr:nucleoside/nucleotide kinase family protein [Marinilactibacillus sp. Marseille-P9653]
MKMKINGLEVDVQYTTSEQKDVLLPLLNQLVALREKKDRRIVVYLAAPPGTGKTTVSQYLEKLHKDRAYPFTFQSISIDGFHFDGAYLAEHTILIDGVDVFLKEVKGSPESFDLKSLKKSLSLLKQSEVIKWPIYDRKLHDVSFEHLSVDADIVLIEGNWLLLDEPGWRDLKQLADLSIFIKAREAVLEPRLIQRKMMGGLGKEAAVAFYKNSDQKNVRRVLKHHSEPDIYWRMQKDGTLKG